MLNFDNYKLWARMGYAARGVIYLTIGALAFLSAMGMGGSKSGSKGAIRSIQEQPFGEVLLVILVIGLIGYILWRFIQGIKDADNHGHSAKGLTIRSGLIISAISHTVLCFWVISLLLENTESSSGQSTSSTVSQYLGPDMTAVVIGLIGLILIGVGIAHFFKGFKASFKKHINFPASKSHWMIPVCQFGLVSRGVVWCIIGWIFIRSAFVAGSNENKGIEDALEWLSTTPFGTWVILIIAVGLVAFGIYSFLEAMYRRISQ